MTGREGSLSRRAPSGAGRAPFEGHPGVMWARSKSKTKRPTIEDFL